MAKNENTDTGTPKPTSTGFSTPKPRGVVIQNNGGDEARQRALVYSTPNNTTKVPNATDYVATTSKRGSLK